MGRLLAGAVAVALLLIACGDDETRTFVDPGDEVTVRVGETFVLDFKTNPGIGTNIDLETRPASNGAVRFVDIEQESESKPQTEGGNVRKRFTFQALRAGGTDLRFVEDFRGEKQTPREVRVIVEE